MRIAILTFDGFNELDSFIAFSILSRVQHPDWHVSLAGPTARVRSMNGVVVDTHTSLRDARSADAVIVGSGVRTRDIVADAALMEELRFDPARQLLAAQCSGTLILAKLGHLSGVPACTDLITSPWVRDAGVETLNWPFFARGNVATAGGCLASHYLATWIIARLEGVEAAERALRYVVPVGEIDEYITRAVGHVAPFLHGTTASEPASGASTARPGG